MEQGYLYLQASRSHPGLVRILTATDSPLPAADQSADTIVRYVARFNDVDAARLHAFTGLRHHLVDVDNGLFRVDETEAIAVLESIALSHVRFYLDPDIGGHARKRIDQRIAQLRQRKVLGDRIWQSVGWMAAGWLAFWALAGL